MQPTLALSASHPGILYLNGHLAGELCAETPLMRPVGSQGAVYLDFRPFTNACRSMTRRLVFSGGMPLAESAESAENLSIVVWPGGAVEIELTPETHAPSLQHFQLGGHSFCLNGETLLLSCDGNPLCTLPAGAQIPQMHSTPQGVALLGECAEGKYLLTLNPTCQAYTGLLRARQLQLESDGRIRAVVSPEDLVGHATLETWRLTLEGLMLISSEPAWSNGAPRWPKTPEETARAAVEAALAGLESEAERYLSPALRNQFPLSGIRDKCDLCVEMKYAPPSSRPCVGLLHLEGAHMGRVSPLYFRASPSGGPQSPYQIDELQFT